MGVYQSNYVIVESWKDDDIEHAHTLFKLSDVIGDLVTPIIKGQTNGVRSFSVMTSGSKAGWDIYNNHLQEIDTVIQELKAEIDSIKIVKVSFGELGNTIKVLR